MRTSTRTWACNGPGSFGSNRSGALASRLCSPPLSKRSSTLRSRVRMSARPRLASGGATAGLASASRRPRILGVVVQLDAALLKLREGVEVQELTDDGTEALDAMKELQDESEDARLLFEAVVPRIWCS